jgi:hypothetical protein
MQERLRAQALEPIASTGVEAATLLRRASERWQAVIRTADIRAD